jgi:hypothetical protein
MEEVLVQIGDVKPTCSAGCGACCHFEVEITRDEGTLLAGLVEAGHPIDRERLEAQASRERLSPEWKRLTVPSNRCVFLGDSGTCTVYADRPSACRKLLVVSDPKVCGEPDGVPVPITIPLAELVLSTMISLPGVEFMSLSKAVRAGLSRSTANA